MWVSVWVSVCQNKTKTNKNTSQMETKKTVFDSRYLA